MKKIIFALMFIMLAGAAALAQDAQAGPKINLIMDDGTLIIYAGSNQGIAVGDEFATTRDGNETGRLKIVRVTAMASYGKVVSGQPGEMDTLTRAAQAAPAKIVEPPKTVEPEPEPVKATPAEDAKAKKKETLEKKPAERKPAEKKPKPAEKKPEEAKKAPEKKPEDIFKKEGRAAAKPVTFHGPVGMVYVPTSGVMPKGRGSAMLHFVNADDNTLGYKDTGYGVAYGITENVEASFVRVKTSPTDSLLSNISLDTNVISLKYAFSTDAPSVRGLSMPKLDLPKQDSPIGYAAGLTYYSMGSTSVAGGDGKVTRLYAVASGKLDKISAHAGAYNQSGNLVDNTDYDGFGFMGGLEYPVSIGFGNGKDPAESMSLIVEYDHKAYYLGTNRTPSVGLRYNSSMFSMTAAVLDVTKTKIFSAGGTFNF